VFPACAGVPNHVRFRIGPEMTIALGTTIMDAEDRNVGQQVELLASRRPGADERNAYERVLGDALEGDATLFARQDYVEEAWRIVDPMLKAGTQVYEYEPGTWGPPETERECGGAHEDRDPRRRRGRGRRGGRDHRDRCENRHGGTPPLRDGGERRANPMGDAARAC
jgi:hypothetical protein